jgi:hypothetical protein
MEKFAKPAIVLGFVMSVAAPLLGLLLYPRAEWLFALVLPGVAIFVLLSRFAPDPTPIGIATQIERLLNRRGFEEWDVDDFECLRIRDPQLKQLWLKAMGISPRPPEEWGLLNEAEKYKMCEVIRQLRALARTRNPSGNPANVLSGRDARPSPKRKLF